MEYLLSSSEMKRCDASIINKMGVPSMVLMEKAALGAEEELYDGTFDLKKIIVVCGNGNNGGDGFVVARLLYLKNIDVTILFVGDEKKCTPETKQQIKIVQNYGIKIYNDFDFNFDGYTTIIDAIFGVGISKPVKGKYAQIIERMNEAEADVFSLDIPSGISADTGEIMGVAIRAKKTATFAYKKVGLVLYPGAEYAGTVKVKDIGITDIGFEGVRPQVYSYTKEDLKRIPERCSRSHKGTYGKILVIAGAVNMGGAAYLAAKSVYRMGAGLVKLYIPNENRTILQTMLPEAILGTYNSDNIDTEDLKEAISWADAIIMGPGMGKNETTKSILNVLIPNADVPLVIDADGVNIIAEHPDILKNHKNNIIITPHLGEMAGLVKKDIHEIEESLIKEAKEYAKQENIVCVLKDARTAVTDGNGGVYLNQSGNNGMATAGSGDVLTGIIAGLLAQGMNNLEAATLGVYIHGLAGDSATSKLGVYSVIADDIVDNISDVLYPGTL
ncbi:MAG TPA: NAD(P)H-hydrate dehydratase [Clostridia bacterium]|nr:NAD(P)H-hydrate dehydratase [Clostridia bacterium]